MTAAPTSATIGLLGPSGTFTEQALLTQPDLAAAQYEFRTSMPAVLQAVEQGDLDFGFVAIENSIEGTVSATIDTLAFSSQLLIQREVDLPIRMQLFALDGAELSDIKRVVSFPHASGQCRVWLRDNLPDAEIHAANSTADAIKDLAEEGDAQTAAIGNALAGELYGLSPLASDIEDHHGNVTRFALVAREGMAAPTGHDKTSIVIFQRADRPGSLLTILQEFAARSINLTKLESRPTKQGIGDYCFIIDLDGHIADELVADALKNIRAKQANVNFLGSYPAVGEQETEVRQQASEAWAEADAWVTRLRRHLT